jgi:hypothetical protein
MDAATITAEHAAARSFLSYLKVEQATALSNQIGADAMLASDPDNAHLKNALVRAVGLLAQADGDVAAQVTAIRNLRAAAPQAPPAGPSPTTTRRSGRELSPPPVPTKKARFSIATAARKIAHPHDDLWLDAQGKIHLVNLAKAARLNLRLDQIWALVDGIAAMLVASGIAAPLSAEVDLLGEALEDVEPCALSPEQIRAALQEIASALEVPALALLHTTLEEGITLNVRHTHGAAVARARFAPPTPSKSSMVSTRRSWPTRSSSTKALNRAPARSTRRRANAAGRATTDSATANPAAPPRASSGATTTAPRATSRSPGQTPATCNAAAVGKMGTSQRIAGGPSPSPTAPGPHVHAPLRGPAVF